MNRLLSILCMALVMLSCKSETNERQPISVTSTETTKEIAIAEKIANAHGFKNWKTVNQIQFRFNVNRNGNTSGRSWTWSPKTNDITLVSDQDTISYNRKSVDSLSLNADKGFINDKFWLLVPFQLIWDEGTTISEPTKAEAPISKNTLNKITLTYGNEGGYTPGDAYDIYYSDDYLIREWIFREGNSETPSMSTTFENYKTYNGIKIATDHKMKEGDFNLFFSNIKVN